MSEVQEMIDESQKSQFLQIAEALRELMANVLKKRDLDTLAVALMKRSSEGRADLVSRITDLEVGAKDAQVRTEETQKLTLAHVIPAMREMLAEVPKSDDLVQHMAGLKNQVNEKLRSITMRVSTLESGAAARKEGLRRRVDEIDCKTRELAQLLAALDAEMESGLQERVEAAFVRTFAAHDREMKAKVRRKNRRDRTGPFDARSKQGRALGGPLKTEQQRKLHVHSNTLRVQGRRPLFVSPGVVASSGLWGQVFGVGLLTPGC